MDMRNLEKITRTFYKFNKKQLLVAIKKTAERGVAPTGVNLKALSEDELRSLAITCAVMAHHQRWSEESTAAEKTSKSTKPKSRNKIDDLIDAKEDYVKVARERKARAAKETPINPLEPVISNNLKGVVATD